MATIAVPSPDMLLERVDTLQQETKESLNAIYLEYHLQDAHESLKDLPKPVLLQLFLAQDLRRAIREKACESFFEWDAIDQAVGGKDEPLGKPYSELRCDAA